MDDLISRSTAIKVLEALMKRYKEIGAFCDRDGVLFAREEIKKLPIIKAAPIMHGRWIDENPDDSLDPRMRCSVCAGIESPLIRWHYCPNCGAKMENDNE